MPFPPQVQPHTPSHHSHRRQAFEAPSSEAGPSRSSTYSTPTHYPHSYPYWFDPGYSSGTLPPSSPIPSSPLTSSPILLPASVPPGQRSQARGRRVSFKLDDHDRPLSATPSPRRASSRRPIDQSDDDHESDGEPRRSRGQRVASAGPSKGKGKARAVSPSDAAEDDEDGKEAAGKAALDRGRPPPRARTPGPPPRRDLSVPRSSATSKDKIPAKKK
ncbi:hypothetical protein BD413DRAFT_586727 [Trametes elegans]|nr:hypothetical protein BD413DRAFT_586727 [Trametes elegans]